MTVSGSVKNVNKNVENVNNSPVSFRTVLPTVRDKTNSRHKETQLIPSTRNRFTPLLQVSNMSATSVLKDLDGDSSNLYGVVGGTNKCVGPSGSECPTLE